MVFFALASSKFEGGFPRNPVRLTAVKYLYTAIRAPSKKFCGGDFSRDTVWKLRQPS
jgi:hypothetical protein